MVTELLHVGIVGAGNIARRHLENLRFLGGNQIVAICDLDLPRAQELAGIVGAEAYRTVDELFASNMGLDAVVICTPPAVRRQIIEQAAVRGIGVYCEKPPAATVAEGLRIAEIIERHNLICSVGFHMRYSPAVDRFRELTDGHLVNVVQSMAASPAALLNSLEGWFFIKERSGGHLMDQAIHTIDLLRYVVGEITEVHTFGNNVLRPKTDDFTIEDTTVSNIRFASGASGSHIHSWAAPKGRSEMLIMGEDFALTLQSHTPPYVRGVLGRPGREQTPVDETFAQGPAMGRSGQISPQRKPEDPPDPPHCGAMQAFLEAVSSGRRSGIRSTYVDGLRSLAVVLGMNRSIDTGQVETITL
jgi:predicted dehydrogenase